MPEPNLFQYIWNEHIEPLFMVPLLPFAVAASILNGRLQSVPEHSVPVVRRLLRAVLTLATFFCFGASVLMVLAGLGWWQAALAGTVSQHLLTSLGFFWLGAGCHLLRGVAVHGNWQIRPPSI